MSVTRKLSILFAITIGTALLSSGAFVLFTYRLDAELDAAINTSQKKLGLLANIDLNLQNMRFGNRGVLLYRSIDPKRHEESRNTYRSALTSLNGSLTQLVPLL